MTRNCLICKKEFKEKLSRIKIGRGKYCSKKCYIEDQKGKHFSLNTEFKTGINLNENHRLWKGEKASYSAKHYWISRKLGKPQKCTSCGTIEAKKFEWANVNQQYKRDINDYIRLCTSCHRRMDGHGYKMWETRRRQILFP